MNSDPTRIPQSLLDIANKTRSNPLAWRGQFSPQLVDVLLDTYSQPTDTVLDPFVGSGTVLGECAQRGQAATGIEVNPAAFVLASVYRFGNVPVEERTHSIEEVEHLLNALVEGELPLFAATDAALADRLAEAVQGTCGGLARVLLDALFLLADGARDGLDARRLSRAWQALRATVLGMPFSAAPLEVFQGDARTLPMADEAIQFVVTSPPYINVFNYHQQYRASAEALGYRPLGIAVSEIGANRKHRANRLLTVIQYCLDMAEVFAELQRVVTADGYVVFVVGRESNVRKTAFYNGQILSAVGQEAAGLRLELEQERVFVNRFGESIIEDILLFSTTASVPTDSESRARDLAKHVLEDARERAPEESLDDLERALDGVDSVRSSPRAQPNGGVAVRQAPGEKHGATHASPREAQGG